MKPLLEELFSLEGKVALVTGASQGIGRGLAEALAGAGASVVLVARNREGLQDTARGIEQQDGRAAVLVCDLAQRAQVTQCAQDAPRLFGDIDILVNCAGVNFRPPVDQIDEKVWDQTMAINVDAPFFLSQKLVPAMRRKKWGRIIHIASQQSVRAFGNSGAYGVSKGGIASMTRGFAEAPTSSSRSHWLLVMVAPSLHRTSYARPLKLLRAAAFSIKSSVLLIRFLAARYLYLSRKCT